MQKAIVVLDKIPENCSDCDLWNDLPSFGEYSQGYRGKCQKTKGLRHSGDGKPLWCPLKEAPEHALIWDRFDDDYNLGYNAALDEILGGDTK